jgi:DNA-binding protein H-NS
VRLSDGTVASASDEALTLIIAEATALTQEAQGELDARAAKREAEFLEMVRQQALVLGVTPARLAAAIAGKPVPRTRANGIDLRSVVRPKYRDPSDPTRTWSGRGNAPPWIELDSATGKPLPTFHIPEGEQ